MPLPSSLPPKNLWIGRLRSPDQQRHEESNARVNHRRGVLDPRHRDRGTALGDNDRVGVRGEDGDDKSVGLSGQADWSISSCPALKSSEIN